MIGPKVGWAAFRTVALAKVGGNAVSRKAKCKIDVNINSALGEVEMDLKRKIIPIIVGLAAYFGVSHFMGSGNKLKDFEVFESEQGRFTVSMPGQPKKETESVPTTVGDMELTIFKAGSNTSQFVICYCDYSQELVAQSDPERMLDGAVGGAVANVKGQLTKDKKLDNYGIPAREIEVNVPGKGIVTTRLILNGRRLYQVMTMLPFDWQDEDKSSQFFDSFKMLK